MNTRKHTGGESHQGVGGGGLGLGGSRKESLLMQV